MQISDLSSKRTENSSVVGTSLADPCSLGEPPVETIRLQVDRDRNYESLEQNTSTHEYHWYLAGKHGSCSGRAVLIA